MRDRNDLAFSMDEYRGRLDQVRGRMVEQALDAVLVTTPENICYLTGFDSVGHYYFNALVVPLDGEPFMVPRQLEDSGVQALTWVAISRPYQDIEDPIGRLAQALAEFELDRGRLGYEKDCWFFTACQQERLFSGCPKAEFVDISGWVEQGRLIKSVSEIGHMQTAARATEAGMRAGIEATVAGASENDVAAEIYHAMIKAGSEWPSISPFVASGPRGAIGHATWAGRTIQSNEFVFLELAGCFHRYHAPMMRTVFTGKPDRLTREAEHLVQAAMDACLAAIKSGVPAGEVDAAGRQVIAKASSEIEQASRTAYSVGIGLPPDWGEGHILSIQPHESRVLEENMTFHLLPWVQIPGKGGVGLSGTIRVTASGCEPLTRFERKLFLS